MREFRDGCLAILFVTLSGFLFFFTLNEITYNESGNGFLNRHNKLIEHHNICMDSNYDAYQTINELKEQLAKQEKDQ